MKTLQKTFGIVFSVAVLAAVIVLIIAARDRMNVRPRTDDAYLQAELVHLAPDVSGRVTDLRIHENQLVRVGEILFAIDSEPYQLAVDRARAMLLSLQAKLTVTADTVASQTAKADAANTSVGSAKAQLALATSTLGRLKPLLKPGFVTAQQVDQARTAMRTAEISLQQAEQQAQEARKGISSVKPEQEELAEMRATLSLAERDLRLTSVRAPCNGLITGLDVSSGEYAVAGHPMFTIIDTDQWHAIGNFRETDLAALKVGQHATVYVLSDPGRPVDGAVESIGWGVSPDEGITIGGLPRVPRSLSWVRIAQRFPVRVVLNHPPPDLMRLGASAVIVVTR